jgi:hypothetical protein
MILVRARTPHTKNAAHWGLSPDPVDELAGEFGIDGLANQKNIEVVKLGKMRHLAAKQVLGGVTLVQQEKQAGKGEILVVADLEHAKL